MREAAQRPAVALGASALGSALLVELRPRQWTKNLLVFVALAFTLNLTDWGLLARAVATFVLFCGLSSAGYLFNDVLDVEADRQHPRKRHRPIAAGTLPVPVAVSVGTALALVGVLGSLAIAPLLGGIAVGYLALTAVYTLWLKHVVLVDIFAIAALFVLRAAAGAVAISVPISPWLYSATLLGALLIALGKRRAELEVLGGDAAGHRRNLDAYSLDFIDQLIVVITSAAVMTYALYTFSAENLPRDHSMMLTVPVVLYGVFRYLFLIRSGALHGAPEDLLFRDRPLLVAVVVWAVLAVTILYAGARASAG
jgi:4-hydroxybenzoate polyprenyltransferase